jgi:opacity protein-like surface antigen
MVSGSLTRRPIRRTAAEGKFNASIVSTAILVLAGMCATVLPASAAWAPTWTTTSGRCRTMWPIETPEPLPLPVGGWYLRGDIGYRIHQAPNGVPGSSRLRDVGEDLEDTGTIGIGVGYRFNDYFRMDGTLDYAFEDARGCGATCRADRSRIADLDAFAGLVNAYVDLGTYGGLTPYVGGGVGAALPAHARRVVRSPGLSGDNTVECSPGRSWPASATTSPTAERSTSTTATSTSATPPSRRREPGQSIEWNDIGPTRSGSAALRPELSDATTNAPDRPRRDPGSRASFPGVNSLGLDRRRRFPIAPAAGHPSPTRGAYLRG